MPVNPDPDAPQAWPSPRGSNRTVLDAALREAMRRAVQEFGAPTLTLEVQQAAEAILRTAPTDEGPTFPQREEASNILLSLPRRRMVRPTPQPPGGFIDIPDAFSYIPLQEPTMPTPQVPQPAELSNLLNDVAAAGAQLPDGDALTALDGKALKARVADLADAVAITRAAQSSLTAAGRRLREVSLALEERVGAPSPDATAARDVLQRVVREELCTMSTQLLRFEELATSIRLNAPRLLQYRANARWEGEPTGIHAGDPQYTNFLMQEVQRVVNSAPTLDALVQAAAPLNRSNRVMAALAASLRYLLARR